MPANQLSEEGLVARYKVALDKAKDACQVALQFAVSRKPREAADAIREALTTIARTALDADTETHNG